MKPICMNCKLFYRPHKNGIFFTEGMPLGARPFQEWKPYKVWQGDLWKCQGCSHEIIVGTGFTPVAIRHQTDFEDTRRAFGADQININDC
jgi:hypothetical protein